MRDIEKIVETFFGEITKRTCTRPTALNFVALAHSRSNTVTHALGATRAQAEKVHVEAKRLPFFKTGKALREQLNSSDS